MHWLQWDRVHVIHFRLLLHSDSHHDSQQSVSVVRPKVGTREMKSLRRIRRDRKGINTILASLLMVVIVVVAAVMVYAWSTGLLSSLLVQNPVPKELINYDSAAYGAGASTYNLTIFIRNAAPLTGNCPAGFASYLPTYSGGSSQGFAFTGGSSYSITVVTTRNNQFQWNFQK